MVTKIVIHHKEMGLFIGATMGLAFWSRLETAGQYQIAWFKSEEQAREFIKDWVPPQDPDEYTYPPVESDVLERGVTVGELIKSGLGSDTKMLLLNMPPESRA